MLFSAQITAKQAAQFCRRMAVTLEAGLDMRSIWAKEAQRATGMVARSRFQTIHEAVAQGHSLREAMDATGDISPEQVREYQSSALSRLPAQ